MTTIIEKKEVNTLVEHELALKVYLDSLLFEETLEIAEAEPALQVVQQSEQDLPQAETVTTEQVSAEQQTEVTTDQPLSAIPEWGRQPFESLVFKVGGFLSLAVPLVKLNGIIKWPEEHQLTAMPGHSEWFLGLLPHRGKQVKVIDIAKFVIPENHKSRAALLLEREFRHIILIKDGEFGLVCDGLGEVLKLGPEDMRWRDDRTSRPWLAGTITEKMCALLDIDHFSEMLKVEAVTDEITRS